MVRAIYALAGVKKLIRYVFANGNYFHKLLTIEPVFHLVAINGLIAAKKKKCLEEVALVKIPLVTC